MAETNSQYNIQDIPEELKPWRNMLMNAAASQVFTPDWIRAYAPDATVFRPQQPQQPQQSPAQPQQPHYPPVEIPHDLMSYMTSMRTPAGISTLAHGADSLDEALGYRFANGGQLRRGAEELERMLADVTLTPGGTPLGGFYPAVDMPAPRLPFQIPTGTRGTTPLPPTINVRPPAAPTQPIPGITPGIPAVTPPPSAPPSGLPPSQPPLFPPVGGGGVPPPANPHGGGSGQVQPQFTSERPANFAGAAQAQNMGYNPAQYAEESVAQELARQMGGTVNYTNTEGPIGPPSQATLNFGGEQHNAGLIADIHRRFADDEGMRNFALNNLRDEIRSYGGAPSFKSGGVVRYQDGGWSQPTDLTGRNVAPTQNAQNPFGGASPALNPYQPYRGQRILGSGGGFGQQSETGQFQVSDPTRSAYSGTMGLPSYFSNGQIDEGRDENGNATTNLGIANDLFDTAGRYSIGAAANSQALSGEMPLRSTFNDMMSFIRDNPQSYMAGDVMTGELTAPQLEAPSAIDVQPGQIDPNQVMNAGSSTAFMQAVPGVGTARFIDPNNPTDYMSPYARSVTDQRRNDAVRSFNEQKQYRDAQMVKSGMFGNSRRGIVDAQAERDLATTLDRITAEGAEGAYLNAQQQFERDQQRNLAGQQTNQRAAIDVGSRNLDAILQGNQLRTNAGLQALLANQSTGLQAALANQRAGIDVGGRNLDAALSTQNLARTTNLAAAQGNQQTRYQQNRDLLNAGTQADQLQQQAAQGNYRNALDAIGQQTNSALAANTIGQSRADLSRIAQGLEIQRIREMLNTGRDLDARTQSALDLGYQDFINQTNFPYQQLNWFQSMLAGTPMGYNSEGVMFNRTSPWTQAAGLGAAGLGALSNYYGSKG